MPRRITDGPVPFNLVQVVWDDAECTAGWDDPNDIKVEPALVLTVGFLVKDTDNHLVVASTVSQEKETGHNSVNSRLQIPKQMIVSYKILQ